MNTFTINAVEGKSFSSIDGKLISDSTFSSELVSPIGCEYIFLK
jgi:hypothetical protein